MTNPFDGAPLLDPVTNPRPAPSKTKHTCGGPVFGHLTPGCPRCDELSAGAAPVRWSRSRRNLSRDERRGEVRAHSCAASGCGPVCTFGDW